MIRIEESVHIARAPDDVWAFVLDYGSDHLWRPGELLERPDGV